MNLIQTIRDARCFFQKRGKLRADMRHVDEPNDWVTKQLAAPERGFVKAG